MVIKMAKKSSDQKKKALLALLLVLTPALILILISSIGCEHRFQKLGDFGAVKPFTFVDADNKTRTLSEFKNDILLITTIQNECPNACAISSGKSSKFEAILIFPIKAPGFRVVVFS